MHQVLVERQAVTDDRDAMLELLAMLKASIERGQIDLLKIDVQYRGEQQVLEIKAEGHNARC